MKKLASKIIILAALSGLPMLSCDKVFSPSPSMLWVQTDPIQCRLNPWEQDWNLSHSYYYPAEKEPEVIRSYYATLGVEIYRLQTKKTYDAVCEACTCPRGDTLYLQIGQEDLETMLDAGFKESGGSQ